jgi:very-short-patch-repair endonuclease
VADSNSAGSTGLVSTLPISFAARHLIIELDGSQHAEPDEEHKDGLRTAYLNQQGYRVPRFWNEQVNTELEGVLQTIDAALTDS